MIDEKKYQPKSYSDLFYGTAESQMRIEDILSGMIPFPSYGKCGIIIYGTFGTGKTTLARILPEEIEFGKTQKELNQPYEFIKCQQGVSGPKVMTLLNDTVYLMSMNNSGLHYIVLDEVDNLTQAAQKSLKSLLNTQSAIFVLTTNYLQQIDKGVQDRCVLVELNAASPQQIAVHIRRVVADMNVVLNDDEIEAIVSAAKGSMREATHAAIRRAARKLRGIDVIGSQQAA